MSPGPEKQKKTKKKTEKSPGDECLLGLSPCRLSFPLLPISFDMAGYVGGLDVGSIGGVHGGGGVPPSSPSLLSPCFPHPWSMLQAVARSHVIVAPHQMMWHMGWCCSR
jgi:hypothetical protein